MYSFLTIGKKVRKLRAKNNMSQVELADLIDVSPSYIGYLEKGLKSMSLETLIKVANVFQVTTDMLLSDCLVGNQSIIVKEMAELLEGCSVYECRIIVENARNLKEVLIENRVIKYIMSKDKPKLFGIFLCLYTGLRIGELLALEWTDVDFVKGEIRINKTCHDGKNQDGVFARITDIPKTQSSIRTIPLPRQFMPLLREAKRKSHSIYVVSNGDKPISVRSYQRTFASFQKNLGIPHRGFHSLRHTFATRALECGMDVKTLSEILGHKNPTVTLNRYVHSLMEHKKEMMNKLGKLL